MPWRSSLVEEAVEDEVGRLFPDLLCHLSEERILREGGGGRGGASKPVSEHSTPTHTALKCSMCVVEGVMKGPQRPDTSKMLDSQKSIPYSRNTTTVYYLYSVTKAT